MWVCTVNVVNICCVEETRFRKNSGRMIGGKAAQFKLFWIKNEKDLGEAEVFLGRLSYWYKQGKREQ